MNLQDKFQNRCLEWSKTASVDEKELLEKIFEYENTYFDDIRFEPDSITGDFFAVEYQDDSRNWHKSYSDPPFCIDLTTAAVKISKIKRSAGRYHQKEHIIYIHPGYKEDKQVILHEMIHAYENLLMSDNRGCILRDILFFTLYKNLKVKIKKIDNLIQNHAHIYRQHDIIEAGGFHGILFYLKSLDLDLRLGLKLGTVCGYGRDEFGTGEEI